MLRPNQESFKLNICLFFFLSESNLKKIILFIYLFLTVLGLHYCAQAFSSCDEWELLSYCSERASPCCGFSYGAAALGHEVLSSCSAWPQ